ncbi:DUF1853 family protein [Pseudomonas asuensis]|nr:DUF1853 family protein [Pseudomonas asuensis]
MMSNPFQTLAALPYALCDPAVRDMAWVITSPPLLDRAEQRHPLTASDWTAKPDKLADWLHELDRKPGQLTEWLAQGNDRRLGRYYERLWQFALAHAPGVDLLGANLPLRTAAQTLGELDLLFRDDQGVHHLEVAVKYYLATGLPQLPDWLGPGGEDRLERKLSHFLGRQLPLSHTSEAQVLLKTLGIASIQSWFWMSGYLFYPPSGATPFPSCSTYHQRGLWQRFGELVPGDKRAWRLLPKHRWLAPAHRNDGHTLFDFSSEPHWPRLLVHFNEQGSEDRRLFWVPQSWPLPDNTSH